MENLTNTAAWLAEEIPKIGDGELFEIISSKPKEGLPLVAWKIKKKDIGYDEYAIASHMRQRNWILPAYSLPPKVHDLKVLRAVIREDFSKSRAEIFLRDLREAVHFFENAPREVQAHMSKNQGKEEKNPHHPAQRSKKQRPHGNDNHSLRASHGKTHAVC